MRAFLVILWLSALRIAMGGLQKGTGGKFCFQPKKIFINPFSGTQNEI